jgi:ferredoxin
MKGVICYYSGSGNTKLACKYMANKTINAEFDFYNTLNGNNIDLEEYDLIGFATFTDFWGIPNFFNNFIDNLYSKDKKPAFVFNTFGNISGKTLIHMSRLANLKGFDIIAGYSLHTPESYPPMPARGNGKEQAPNEKEMKNFNNFISEFDALLKKIKEGKEIKRPIIKNDLISYILPAFSRIKARQDMGDKYVDDDLCDECGICKRKCPYGAIELNPRPIFDMNKCYGCWACYNHCPKLAIYTKKFRGMGHYPRPHKNLVEKLKS